MIGKMLVSMAVVGATSGAAVTGGKQLMDSAKALTGLQSRMILDAGKQFANPQDTYTASDDDYQASVRGLQALAAQNYDQIKPPQ